MEMIDLSIYDVLVCLTDYSETRPEDSIDTIRHKGAVGPFMSINTKSSHMHNIVN